MGFWEVHDVRFISVLRLNIYNSPFTQIASNQLRLVPMTRWGNDSAACAQSLFHFSLQVEKLRGGFWPTSVCSWLYEKCAESKQTKRASNLFSQFVWFFRWLLTFSSSSLWILLWASAISIRTRPRNASGDVRFHFPAAHVHMYCMCMCKQTINTSYFVPHILMLTFYMIFYWCPIRSQYLPSCQ